MKTEEMDKDLTRYDDFEQLSERVNYWRRRLAVTKPNDDTASQFDEIVGKHSRRVLSVLRAG